MIDRWHIITALVARANLAHGQARRVLLAEARIEIGRLPAAERDAALVEFRRIAGQP